MVSMLDDYESLPAVAPAAVDRKRVATALSAISDAYPMAFDLRVRTRLIELLLQDLGALADGAPSRLTTDDATRALLALKNLGKVPAGAAALGTRAHLSALLRASEAFGAAPDAWSEAWRCIANTVLQHEPARTTWVTADVGGGAAAIALLADAVVPPERVFLLGRTMLLTSASSMGPTGEYVRALVEERDVVRVLGARLDALAAPLAADAKMAREAVGEVVKCAFNIIHMYPKVARDELVSPAAAANADADDEPWSPALDGLLAPLLRLFAALAPTAPGPLVPPLTSVVHSLMGIPVTPLRETWFAEPAPSSPPRAGSGSGAGSAGTSRSSSPAPRGSSESVRRPGTIERALSALSRRRASPPAPAPRDALEHARRTFELALAHYLPGACDPDAADVRARADDLDELLTPPAALLRNFVLADPRARTRLAAWLWPADLDRSPNRPLEQRPDALGRCLRLLGSVYHTNTKEVVGDLLYTIADRDAGALATQVGYGNVAGLLYSKGIMSAPGAGGAAGAGAGAGAPAGGALLNPITGLALGDPGAGAGDEMTDEEKEAEAEKLFVLFDRLERNGALAPAQNPVRRAMEESQRRAAQ